MRKRRVRRIPSPKKDNIYRQIWKVVDGAVQDAFKMHPEYLSEIHQEKVLVVRNSINKRVTGALMGYAKSVGPPRPDGTGG